MQTKKTGDKTRENLITDLLKTDDTNRMRFIKIIRFFLLLFSLRQSDSCVASSGCYFILYFSLTHMNLKTNST